MRPKWGLDFADQAAEYHSLFYKLLTVCRADLFLAAHLVDSQQWQNPRATAITFAASVVFIFMARYIDILRYALKLSYIVLGGMHCYSPLCARLTRHSDCVS